MDASKSKDAPAPSEKLAGTAKKTEREIMHSQIVPNPTNRHIDESDERFVSLADSIRLLGVLVPVHVRARVDGKLVDLIDGERRWRASGVVGLPSVPCVVWPATATDAEITTAALVISTHRQDTSLVHMARQLNVLKNSSGGRTQEQLARETAIPLDRVQALLGLLVASDDLLEFFSRADVPLKVAAEMVRYEKATNEAKSRKLIAAYEKAPLTREQIVQLTKDAKDAKRRGGEQKGGGGETADAPAARRPSVARALEKAFRVDEKATLAELDAALQVLGYRLARVETTAAAPAGAAKNLA